MNLNNNYQENIIEFEKIELEFVWKIFWGWIFKKSVKLFNVNNKYFWDGKQVTTQEFLLKSKAVLVAPKE